ncbi:peptidase M50 [Corallococcus sp. H22C18031201]|uniref:site-2 protease family protein n=1 Tax=Citreicoccus inhibens TaxID=2849499 RepID=UPI000E74448D|nr:site-2 protease family protein [Citreicoccus inhibens]MBU8895385.1 site-2 protease family protein [Citreicoccus inhibens]RJS22574.1 peptidase M50 [Corallococcus sp. H22C18031201]
MFRFRLGSIPVEVQLTHLMFSAALAYQSLPTAGRGSTAAGWLGERLLDPQGPGYGSAVATYVLSWMLIVFVSVLVHELGHAVVFRLYGYQPRISLVFLGGVTDPHATAPLPWHREVFSSLAGPMAGLGLGLGCKAVLGALDTVSPAAYFFLQHFFEANVFWAVLNLLPVPPLDGGHISTAVATRVFGRRGLLVSGGLSLLLCLGVVALSWARGGGLFLTFLFAMFGFRALRMVSVGLKGDNVRLEEAEMQALHDAREALASGRLDDARRLGHFVLESEALTPTHASRAHHLLGWVALKQGQGRVALDHFSQVQAHPQVETHAMAAALSLIGDEQKAVAAWELAWRETGDRTVLHEFAGSLIRMGKVQEALRLPQVEPAAAFQCAERALFIRGAYSEAAAVSEAALEFVPDPGIAYDAACAFSRARNVSDAVRLLRRASELGFHDAAYAASDEDLAPLHGHPAFESWLAELRASRAS